MAPAGGSDETGESGGSRMRHGVDQSAAAAGGGGAAADQNLGTESGIGKMKSAVMSKDLINLDGNGVACEDTQRILKEIEDLRAELDEDVKELGYCEANQKLRAELALKAKEMQCLRKQNEEMQHNSDRMRKQNELLQAKNDGMAKQNKELQAKNDDLVKENKELRTNVDRMGKRNGELHAKKTKWNQELQAKNDVLKKQSEELQAKNDGLKKQSEELQAKIDGLTKNIEELQAKNVSLVKQNEDLHANNDSMCKRNGELQAKNDALIMRNEDLQAKNDNLTKLIEELEEKMCNLHRRPRENALRIFQENENLRQELDNKRRERNSRAKKLEKLSAENANDRKTLDDERQKAKDDNSELELASIEQQRADEDVLKLLDDQKREKEGVFARLLQLEKELLEKQQLELEAARLNGTLQVMKHLEGDDDGDIHEKMEKLSERLEHEKQRLEDLTGDLVRKERESNDELQQARKELILGLEDELNGRTGIAIKRMGELDEKPFQNACKRKYGNDDYQTKAAELVSSWQEELKKPSWHPFKVVQVNGEAKEVLDDDDAKLKYLWIEYGDDVRNAVKTALMEMGTTTKRRRG